MATAPSSASVLVVDDEPDLRTLYELTLLREGHAVVAAPDITQAREWLAQQRFDVLISDMRLPDGLGLDLLRELADAQRPEKCIVITAYGSAENAVESLKAGAFDYLTKPVDLKQLRSAVTAALQSQRGSPAAMANGATAPAPNASGAGDAPRKPAATSSGAQSLRRIVGASPSIAQIKSRIEKVASSMAPVLILGESGTGKELVARAVHDCSHRSGGPFVAVNCGAIPENLIEAEFFGARKGAYTGATTDREGYFQAARGGTLFLDEIGDLPLAMQAKLLRVIQERRVRALGGVQEEAVDVRLVSATHRDLNALVQSGQFRQDLFYRLNVIGLRSPALRERREDLPLLVEALLARLCAESGQTCPGVGPRPGLVAVARTAGQCARAREPVAARPGPEQRRGARTGRLRRGRRDGSAHPARSAHARRWPRRTHDPPARRDSRRPADLPGRTGAPSAAQGAARMRLQPHRGRGPPGPEPAPDALPHPAAGHRHAVGR